MPAVAKAPTYQSSIVDVMRADAKRMSAPALAKAVAAKRGVELKKCTPHVKLALKKMVEKKLVQQVKGTGFTGTFRLLKLATAEPKKVVKKKVLKKKPVKKVAKKTVKKTLKTLKKKAPKPSGAKKAAKKPVKKAPAKKAIASAAKAYRTPAAAAKKQPAKKQAAKKKAPAAAAKKAKK